MYSIFSLASPSDAKESKTPQHLDLPILRNDNLVGGALYCPNDPFFLANTDKSTKPASAETAQNKGLLLMKLQGILFGFSGDWLSQVFLSYTCGQPKGIQWGFSHQEEIPV